MNATFEAVVGNEPRDTREVYLPAGVSITRETRTKRRGRTVPNNAEMVAWLDASTPGWYTALKGEQVGKVPRRIIIFATSKDAALFKLFWS